MKTKAPLFIGIGTLITGILLRIFTPMLLLGLLAIVTGAAFKVYYIFKATKTGYYKPGFEILLLVSGLFLFLFHQNLIPDNVDFSPIFLKTTGIVLKICFVLAFIIKTRK